MYRLRRRSGKASIVPFLQEVLYKNNLCESLEKLGTRQMAGGNVIAIVGHNHGAGASTLACRYKRYAKRCFGQRSIVELEKERQRHPSGKL